MLISARIAKLTIDKTNMETCSLTGLKNFELKMLKENSLEITDEVEKKLNFLEKRNWKKEWIEYQQQLFHARIVYGMWMFLAFFTLDPGVISISALFIVLIVEGLFFRSNFFYYIARSAKQNG